jgi:HEAT repeat protein/ATP/ADP translocase
MRSAGSFFAVRPGEGALVGLLAGLFATIEAGRGLGDVAVTTLFLSRVGADSLPYLFIALGLVSLVVAVGYGAGIGALPRRLFLVGMLAGFAAILTILRLAAVSDSISVYGLLWVAVNVVNAILLTVIWTIAGTTLDARQAKRLFPLCTSAAIGGSFVGTLAAGPLAAIIGTENLVLLDAGLLLTAAALTARIVKRYTRSSPGQRTQAPLSARLRMGFEEVRRSPLLRLVAVSYVLLSVLLFSVTFPYQGALQRTFGSDEAGLATFVGLILAGVTAVSFVVSIALANRVYVRFGVATAVLLLPLVYLVGFGVWLVQFSLPTAVAFLFGLQVVQRSLSNAAWSAIYNVVPTERRPQALAFIDGVPGQLGTTLSGILLLIAGALFTTTQTPIFVMGAITAVACTRVVVLIRRRYGLALVQTLRGGLAEQVLEGGPGLDAIRGEPAVLAELHAALRDPSPATRRLVADLLGRIRDPDAVTLLRGLLEDEDTGVRVGAVRALTAIEPSAVVLEAERLAADPSPTVRGELAAAVATAGDAARAREWITDLLASDAADDRIAGLEAAGRASEQTGSAMRATVRKALADPVPTVRAAAARALAHRRMNPHAGADDETAVRMALVAALDDEAVTVRRDAATALSTHVDARTAVVQVLTNGSERAQEAALVALAGSGEDLRAPVRTWALARVRDATRLRTLAVALDVAPTQGTPRVEEAPNLDFLRGIVRRRELRIQEQLLAAVAALGTPEATSLLKRCLRSLDSDIRAQAVEAIDALGDRQLLREFVALLDADPRPSTTDQSEALRSLTEDPDPWIRTFALRSIGDQLSMAHRELSERVSNDPDPLVRMSLGLMINHGGGAMTETARTLGELDRMLFLRKVPLFGQIGPEDLQRIAATASERLYPAGESLMTEGDLGEELIVIVEGDVRVVHVDGDGERLLRTYQAGDHIGELAVLRDRPRAATVIAGEHGVRGLVIGGEALRSILRERPEAAMAMLGTLAERISAQ